MVGQQLGNGKLTEKNFGSSCQTYPNKYFCVWIQFGLELSLNYLSNGVGQHHRGLVHERRSGFVKWVTIGRASFCVFVSRYYYLET